jgi:hypothetical protein
MFPFSGKINFLMLGQLEIHPGDMLKLQNPGFL